MSDLPRSMETLDVHPGFLSSYAPAAACPVFTQRIVLQPYLCTFPLRTSFLHPRMGLVGRAAVRNGQSDNPFTDLCAVEQMVSDQADRQPFADTRGLHRVRGALHAADAQPPHRHDAEDLPRRHEIADVRSAFVLLNREM
eukprot:175593-Rhodomonas_salina.2